MMDTLDIIKWFYNDDIYTKEHLKIFVDVKYMTSMDYYNMTGEHYTSGSWWN